MTEAIAIIVVLLVAFATRGGSGASPAARTATFYGDSATRGGYFVDGALRQEANDQAGRFVWSAVKDLAKRGAYVAVFLALIYAAGGWGLLKTVALSLWNGAKS